MLYTIAKFNTNKSQTHNIRDHPEKNVFVFFFPDMHNFLIFIQWKTFQLILKYLKKN